MKDFVVWFSCECKPKEQVMRTWGAVLFARGFDGTWIATETPTQTTCRTCAAILTPFDVSVLSKEGGDFTMSWDEFQTQLLSKDHLRWKEPVPMDLG